MDNDDFLVYDTATGVLSYDADGNGSATQIEFVKLTGIPALTGADIMIT